jgi:hypothetical protein
MHFSLPPWRRFLGHLLPPSVLKSRSRLSGVRASLTARSHANHLSVLASPTEAAILRENNGRPRLNKHAHFAEASWGEEHKALLPGMKS